MGKAIEFRSRAVRRRICFLTAIGLALLAPLIAMRFTTEVNWTLVDFAAAAAVVGTASLAYEILASKVRSRRKLAIGGAAILFITLAIWAEGAVGLFD
jgi:hypothetical protein